MKTNIILSLLATCLLSTTSFAMEPLETYVDMEKEKEIRFIRKATIEQYIKEYKEKGKPISLAVACRLGEMEEKITEHLWGFASSVPAIENWVSLDLCDAQILMDATNADHWKQTVGCFKENNVEFQTVALTICAPQVSSAILRDTIWPLVKKGGTVIYPECFRTGNPFIFWERGAYNSLFSNNVHVRCSGNLSSHKYGTKFDEGLWHYHNPQGRYYQNKEALVEYAMGWMDGTTRAVLQPSASGSDVCINPVEPEKRLEAKVFANCITSVKPEFLKDGEWLYEDRQLRDGLILREYKILETLKALGIKIDAFRIDVRPLFSKSQNEFAEDYYAFFKDYMRELGFDESSYKLYASKEHLLKGLEVYEYPKDGTFKPTGYRGWPSLVLRKNN